MITVTGNLSSSALVLGMLMRVLDKEEKVPTD